MKAALRCDISRGGRRWDTRRLRTRVAGLSLLARHVLGLRDAGVTEVVVVSSDDAMEVEQLVTETPVPGVAVRVIRPDDLDPVAAPLLTQHADTLVDPRVVSRIVGAFRDHGVCIECVAHSPDPEPAASTSPYAVGVPTREDIEPMPADAASFPLGLSWGGADTVVPFSIGRHYWHRIWSESDARVAARKVLLATMKPTDGMYARTNRRVSLRITAWLLNHTRVGPNAVTLLTLGWSALAGALFAAGSYPLMVAGSLVSWFASMLDGVDGELARSKFQATRFGAWLEMACDYAYYVLVFSGMGIGVYRRTGDPLWLGLGIGSAIGAVLAFAAVAWWRRRYFATPGNDDAGYAFQQSVETRAADPLLSFTRRTMVLATRAALPYYIVAFTVLNLVELLLACTFVGTHAAWLLVMYASRTSGTETSPVPLRSADEARVTRS